MWVLWDSPGAELPPGCFRVWEGLPVDSVRFPAAFVLGQEFRLGHGIFLVDLLVLLVAVVGVVGLVVGRFYWYRVVLVREFVDLGCLFLAVVLEALLELHPLLFGGTILPWWLAMAARVVRVGVERRVSGV